jgi:large subunit ribosomal protein L20
MTRVKGGAARHRKHRNILTAAKGYRGTRNKLFKRAHEAVMRSGEHAFTGRKQRRRDMRRLWISRISAAVAQHDMNYSTFMKKLTDANIGLNRKMLSQMAIEDKSGFENLVKQVKG